MRFNKPRPVSYMAGQNPPKPNAELRGSLQKTIEKIEKRTPQLCENLQTQRASLGIMEIDQALDPVFAKGIAVYGLHEVRVTHGIDAASGAGFALCLGMAMTRELPKVEDAKPELPVFWICDNYTKQEYGSYYGPGLCALGLEAEDLIRIHPSNLEESLWAAGEIAATGNAARFCLMEVRGHPKALDLTTTRRLMLRAQSAQTPIIILRQSSGEEASSALTRWHILPASSRKAAPVTNPLMHQFIGPPAFTVHLEKCRGGNVPLNPFIMEWNPHDQCFALAGASSTLQPKRSIGSDHGKRFEERSRQTA